MGLPCKWEGKQEPFLDRCSENLNWVPGLNTMSEADSLACWHRCCLLIKVQSDKDSKSYF